MAPDSIESVMQRIEPLLDDFHAIASQAVGLYHSDYSPAIRIEHSKRTQACCMYDHMVAECLRRFDEHPDVKPFDLGGLKLWLVGRGDPHTVLRWKKMDEDGKSRNYPTRQAKMFDLMRPLEGLPPEPTRITVGYWLNPAGLFQRAQVARPNGQLVDWCAAIIPPPERKADAKKWEEVTKQPRLTG